MAKIYPLHSKSVHPQLDEPRYKVSQKYAPKKPLVLIPSTLSERTGPVFGDDVGGGHEFDLTGQHDASPIGERILIFGRVLDEDGRGIPKTLIEMWQANAAGRYIHKLDDSPAALDPNFDGAGRVLTNEHGEFSFVTIKPGPYQFIGNLDTFWRSRHIHLSLFGTAFTSRLVTQMYFPGDPLHRQDCIFQSVNDEVARNRLTASLDLEKDVPQGTLAYRFDLVLRGREATPLDEN